MAEIRSSQTHATLTYTKIYANIHTHTLEDVLTFASVLFQQMKDMDLSNSHHSICLELVMVHHFEMEFTVRVH